MLNEKIDKLISELEHLKFEIEQDKAIDRCKLRILEMMDDGAGDCGVDENGDCIGYSYDGGACEECRTCAYSAFKEEI